MSGEIKSNDKIFSKERKDNGELFCINKDNAFFFIGTTQIWLTYETPTCGKSRKKYWSLDYSDANSFNDFLEIDTERSFNTPEAAAKFTLN
jgi:hypothetical protein